MPLPVEPTFTAGVVATAAQLNQAVQVSDFLLRTKPLAKMRQVTATTALPVNTDTAIVFDGTDVDTDGGLSHTAANDRYVCRTAGWYTVHANVCFAPGVNADYAIVLTVNGVDQQGVTSAHACTTFATSLPLSKNVHMNVNDYLQVKANTTVATNTFINPGNTSTCDIYFNLQG